MRLYTVVGYVKSAAYSGRFHDRWFIGFRTSKKRMTYREALDYAHELRNTPSWFDCALPAAQWEYVVKLAWWAR